jgi:integrase
LIEVADLPAAIPARHDFLSRWFRPRLVTALRIEHITTVHDLIHTIETRGSGWWRSIPRVGALRANVLTVWLTSHATTLGTLKQDTTSIAHPAPIVMLDPAKPQTLAPFGRFGLPAHLDGSHGINRHPKFSFIAASNDLDAVQSYLLRYRDQPHTLRAYKKELERFLLWSVMVARKPLSSLLVDDCEAYKDFLKVPVESFKGPRAPRFSPRWKPFADDTEGLSTKSQRYAYSVITALFDYLVNVRYLGGNPWVAVTPPRIIRGRKPMDIDKALPEALWVALIEQMHVDCTHPENAQNRVALAALLLLGDSGLRRQEAAGSRLADLGNPKGTVSLLEIVGKGNKLRVVPVSARTINALRMHWADRGLDFDRPADRASNSYLLAPLVIPSTACSLRKHAGRAAGYTADGLYRVLKRALGKIAKAVQGTWSAADIDRLLAAGAHSFRHTFGSVSVAHDMPLPITQRILGHASLNTTSIYVRAEEDRMVDAAAHYYGG